jgi:hypothetical protein
LRFGFVGIGGRCGNRPKFESQIRYRTRINRRNRYFARNELSRLCLGVLRTAADELLSTDDIAGQVIATKGFDAGDAILRAAIREQIGSTIKRLHREGTIKNIGAGRASKWKLTDA